MKMTSNAESTRAQHLNGRYLSQNDCSGGAKRPTLAPPTGGGQQPASRLRGSPRDTFFCKRTLTSPELSARHVHPRRFPGRLSELNEGKV